MLLHRRGTTTQPEVLSASRCPLYKRSRRYKYFRLWADRIKVVNDGLIEDMLEYLRSKSMLTKEDAEAVRIYLLNRKHKILEMIGANKGFFSKIPADDWSFL